MQRLSRAVVQAKSENNRSGAKSLQFVPDCVVTLVGVVAVLERTVSDAAVDP